MKDLIIGLGAGGNAKVVIEILETTRHAQIYGLLDSDCTLWGQSVLGIPVLGDDSMIPGLLAIGVTGFFIGIGSISSLEPRSRLYNLACSCNLKPVAAVHPTSVISGSASIGSGFTAMAASVVNACASLGDNVVVNTGAIVEHDCVVGNHVHISPRAVLLGGVSICDNSMIGAGAVIRQGIKIGSNVMVGAGAVVVADVRDGEVVVGIPARPLHVDDMDKNEP